MKSATLIPFFCLLLCAATANDTIQVRFSKPAYAAKDSIEFSCRIQGFAEKGLAAATMNVWIQSVQTGQLWKFRYPILNGVLDAALAIGDSIPPGRYAVNFILQRGLFKVQGVVKNNYSHSRLNYLAMLKGNKRLINDVELNPNGNFLLKNIVFEDQALFVFSPHTTDKKKKKNDLFIEVSTPLDSAFTPLAVHTQLIDIKPELMKQATPNANSYHFDFEKTYANSTLPEVVVVHNAKKKVQLYDEKYSTGLFRNDEARIFDGLDDTEMMSYQDIPSYLFTKVPGLVVTSTGMLWRGEPVMVYIDEFRLEPGDDIYITPSEVAMIKVYSPPAAVNSGFSFGGAVAIYSKRGSFETNSSRRFKFVFRGYTGFDSAWR